VRTGQLTMGRRSRSSRTRSRTPSAPRTLPRSRPGRRRFTSRCSRSRSVDEVIVPAYTFPATASVVELCGARAVLVDVDPDTFNVDVAAVAASVGPSTRA
jgi:hypothetical protein